MEEQKDQKKQKNTEPHVQIFGEEVGGGRVNREERRRWRQWRREQRQNRYWHHHHAGGAVWGLMLLLGGGLLLLNNMGVVPWQIWHFIWPFWPALLVLVGLRIIFGLGWASETIILLLTLAVFSFIILYGLIQVHSSLVNHLPPGLVNFISNFRPSL